MSPGHTVARACVCFELTIKSPPATFFSSSLHPDRDVTGSLVSACLGHGSNARALPHTASTAAAAAAAERAGPHYTRFYQSNRRLFKRCYLCRIRPFRIPLSLCTFDRPGVYGSFLIVSTKSSYQKKKKPAVDACATLRTLSGMSF